SSFSNLNVDKKIILNRNIYYNNIKSYIYLFTQIYQILGDNERYLNLLHIINRSISEYISKLNLIPEIVMMNSDSISRFYTTSSKYLNKIESKTLTLTLTQKEIKLITLLILSNT